MSRGGAAILQFICTLVYGSKLSITDFGYLSLLMIFVALAYSLIDFGVANTLITNYLTKTQHNALILINLTLAIVVNFSIYTFTHLVQSTELIQNLKIIGIALLIHSLSIVPYSRMHRAGWQSNLALVDFFSVVIQVIVFFILILNDFGLLTFSLALCAHAFVRLVIIKRYYKSRLHSPDFANLKVIFSLMLRQYVSNVVTFLNGRIDQLILVSIVSTEIFGYFSFLKQLIVYPMTMLISIYTQISFPFLSRNRSRNITRILIYSYCALSAILVTYFLILYSFPKEIAKFYIEYWDFQSRVALLLFFYALCKLVFDIILPALTATGLIHKQLKLNIITLVLMVAVGALLNKLTLAAYLFSISFIFLAISTIAIKILNKSRIQS